MRVAHFIQRYPPALGGSEAYFARLSHFLVEQGDEVQVFTSTALDLEAFWSRRGAVLPSGTSVQDGVSVRRYPLWRCPGRRYLLKGLSLLPHRLWQCLTLPCNPICPSMWLAAGDADIACDVVHATAFPYAWPMACAWRLARRLHVPLLLTPFLHLGDPTDAADRTRRGYTSPALRWLLGQADLVFVQTPSEYDAAVGLGVEPARLQLQGLGVEPGECTGGRRDALRLRQSIAPAAIVVGHLANQSQEKGTIDLLRGAERAWHAGCAVEVFLAGPQMPNFVSFWQDFARRTPAEWLARVHQLGVLKGAEKKDFFAAIDLFVLPSRSDSFGLVLLEAWANGVPNIAYRAGGVADVIRDGRDGVLVRCGDIAELTNAIVRLAQSPARRLVLGEAGRERTDREFRWWDKLAVVREATQRGAKKDRTDPVTRTLPTS
jgi:glycosyltransferase involved in cell wall biosynthesis